MYLHLISIFFFTVTMGVACSILDDDISDSYEKLTKNVAYKTNKNFFSNQVDNKERSDKILENEILLKVLNENKFKPNKGKDKLLLNEDDFLTVEEHTDSDEDGENIEFDNRKGENTYKNIIPDVKRIFMTNMLKLIIFRKEMVFSPNTQYDYDFDNESYTNTINFIKSLANANPYINSLLELFVKIIENEPDSESDLNGYLNSMKNTIIEFVNDFDWNNFLDNINETILQFIDEIDLNKYFDDMKKLIFEWMYDTDWDYYLDEMKKTVFEIMNDNEQKNNIDNIQKTIFEFTSRNDWNNYFDIMKERSDILYEIMQTIDWNDYVDNIKKKIFDFMNENDLDDYLEDIKEIIIEFINTADWNNYLDNINIIMFDLLNDDEIRNYLNIMKETIFELMKENEQNNYFFHNVNDGLIKQKGQILNKNNNFKEIDESNLNLDQILEIIFNVSRGINNIDNKTKAVLKLWEDYYRLLKFREKGKDNNNDKRIKIFDWIDSYAKFESTFHGSTQYINNYKPISNEDLAQMMKPVFELLYNLLLDFDKLKKDSNSSKRIYKTYDTDTNNNTDQQMEIIFGPLGNSNLLRKMHGLINSDKQISSDYIYQILKVLLKRRDDLKEYDTQNVVLTIDDHFEIMSIVFSTIEKILKFGEYKELHEEL